MIKFSKIYRHSKSHYVVNIRIKDNYSGYSGWGSTPNKAIKDAHRKLREIGKAPRGR